MALPFLVVALLMCAGPARAQDEAALRAFFEGKRVVVKIDMPGTSDGVDVHVDASRAIDYPRLGERLEAYGTAIHQNESATVTLVKMKRDLIEFQLNGGGFGTFGDDTSTSVSLRRVEKSGREKDLEKRIDDENDSRRRREMERELDNLRDRRERENHRLEAERDRLEEIKKERVAEQRLKGGSRFNVRYSGSVPAGIRPDEVMAALRDYIDLEPASPPLAAAASESFDLLPRKGMLRADAEHAFGKPTESSATREGTLSVTRLVFLSDDRRIAAEFVEDVLVRYTMTSK